MDLNHRPEKLLSPTELRQSVSRSDRKAILGRSSRPHFASFCLYSLSRDYLVISQDFHKMRGDCTTRLLVAGYPGMITPGPVLFNEIGLPLK